MDKNGNKRKKLELIKYILESDNQNFIDEFYNIIKEHPDTNSITKQELEQINLGLELVEKGHKKEYSEVMKDI